MINRLADYWFSISKGSKRLKLWRWITLSLTIVMVVYLVYAFTRGSLRLNQINWRQSGTVVVAALGLYLLSLIIQFFVWARIISFSRKVNWQDVDIYCRSILMRSLPGGAWHWVARISMYSGGTELPTRIVVIGNFLEWGLLTLCAAGIFFGTLHTLLVGLPFAALSFGIAIWLAISWQPATRKWIARLIEACFWIFAYLLSWLLATAIFFLFVQVMAGPDKLSWWQALHGWTLTGFLGMLVIMLPSSLGVREITLTWLFQAELTPSIALMIAVVLRIIYTLADALWGLIGWFLSYLILRWKYRLASQTDSSLETRE